MSSCWAAPSAKLSIAFVTLSTICVAEPFLSLTRIVFGSYIEQFELDRIFKWKVHSLSSRLPVKFLKLVSSKRTIKPHVRQLFLDAVRTEALVQVFEIDEIEMLVLVEA